MHEACEDNCHSRLGAKSILTHFFFFWGGGGGGGGGIIVPFMARQGAKARAILVRMEGKFLVFPKELLSALN